jgi:hypothetical protein
VAALLRRKVVTRARRTTRYEDGVFGVVNELSPAPEELAVVEQDAEEHVLPIGEVTPRSSAACGSGTSVNPRPSRW